MGIEVITKCMWKNIQEKDNQKEKYEYKTFNEYNKCNKCSGYKLCPNYIANEEQKNNY